MTVCVAAICQWNEVNPKVPWVPMIVGAADRMLTAGDVQYEPMQAKIQQIAPRFVVMIAGDASVHAGAIQSSAKRASEAKTSSTRQLAEIYAEEISAHRNKEAETIILSPLGMTLAYFLKHQNELSQPLVDEITARLQRYRIEAEAVVGGVDSGPHPYIVRASGQIVCQDYVGVGFAAIGIGASHAASHLMFSRHSRVSSFPDIPVAYVLSEASR